MDSYRLCGFHPMKASIGKATQELSITRETLRRWEKAGRIVTERTPKGHRRYNLTRLLGITYKINFAEKRTVAYARVSSHDQKEDLHRQAAVLESYRASHGWVFEPLQDFGSDLNYSKKSGRGLAKCCKRSLTNRFLPLEQGRPSIHKQITFCLVNNLFVLLSRILPLATPFVFGWSAGTRYQRDAHDPPLEILQKELSQPNEWGCRILWVFGPYMNPTGGSYQFSFVATIPNVLISSPTDAEAIFSKVYNRYH